VGGPGKRVSGDPRPRAGAIDPSSQQLDEIRRPPSSTKPRSDIGSSWRFEAETEPRDPVERDRLDEIPPRSIRLTDATRRSTAAVTVNSLAEELCYWRPNAILILQCNAMRIFDFFVWRVIADRRLSV